MALSGRCYHFPTSWTQSHHGGPFLSSFFFFGGGAGVPHVMWNPSSPTRDRTHASALESQSPSPWTTRAVPFLSLLQTPYMF